MASIGRARLIGLAGSLLLAISAWMASPWGLGFAGRFNPLWLRWVHTVPAVAGIVLLFFGWLRLRGAEPKQIWQTFALWCVPLLLCPPLLSKDAWAYLEQGWIVWQGHDPYTSALGTVGGPFAGRVDQYWKYTTTIYPPVALMIQAAVVGLSGANPLWSLLAMRVPGLLAVLVIGRCLPRIAAAGGQTASNALWLGLANPVVLVHFIGGAHNDSWGVALCVAGLWLAIRARRWWPLGCVAVGLGMAVKQPLGLMMVAVCLVGATVVGRRDTENGGRVADNEQPAEGEPIGSAGDTALREQGRADARTGQILAAGTISEGGSYEPGLGHPGQGRFRSWLHVANRQAAAAWAQMIGQALWRLPVGLVFTLVGFAIPTVASGWGIGWAAGSGAPTTAGSQSVAHTVAAAIEMFTPISLAGAKFVVNPIFLVLGLLAIIWIGWLMAASRPVAFTAWALIIFAFSYPSLQPWYPLWGGVLLGTIGLGRRSSAWVIAGTGAMLTTNVFLDYAGLPIPAAQGIALACAVLLAYWNLRGKIGRLDWPSPAS